MKKGIEIRKSSITFNGIWAYLMYFNLILWSALALLVLTELSITLFKTI